MSWLFLGLAPLLGVLAAVALRTRRYRLDDDELRRSLSPWWVPVVVTPATLLAAPFFAGEQPVVLLTYAVALVWASCLGLIDLEVHRLPDGWTLPAYPVAAVLLAGCSWVTSDWAALLRAGTCAGAALACFLLVVLLSPGGGTGFGLGDAKLAGVLGALLGWFSWNTALLGLLSGFVVAGLGSAVLLILRRANRKSAIAFGPAMIIGAYVWCVLGAG